MRPSRPRGGLGPWCLGVWPYESEGTPVRPGSASCTSSLGFPSVGRISLWWCSLTLLGREIAMEISVILWDKDLHAAVRYPRRQRLDLPAPFRSRPANRICLTSNILHENVERLVVFACDDVPHYVSVWQVPQNLDLHLDGFNFLGAIFFIDRCRILICSLANQSWRREWRVKRLLISWLNLVRWAWSTSQPSVPRCRYSFPASRTRMTLSQAASPVSICSSKSQIRKLKIVYVWVGAEFAPCWWKEKTIKIKRRRS